MKIYGWIFSILIIASVIALANWWYPPAQAAGGGVITTVNSQGVAGVPVSVGACSGAATKVLAGNNTRASWTILPEGADIRCNVGTAGDTAASPAPTATVGFLFKSNSLVPETTLNIGSSVAMLRLDCCGVSGAVSVDSWEE